MKFQVVFVFTVCVFVCLNGAFGEEANVAPKSNPTEERNKRAILAAAPVAYASPYVAAPYAAQYAAQYASPYAAAPYYPYAYTAYSSPLAAPLVAAPYAKAVAAPAYASYAYYR